MKITAESVITFVRENNNRHFRTLARKRPFSVRAENDGITYVTSEGKPRPNDRRWVEKYVAVFNRHRDFKTPRYVKQELRNASYFLALVHAMNNTAGAILVPLESLPDELRAILEAPETERRELLKSRIGQGRFRKSLIKLRRQCYVTGLADERFLRASHIKAWRTSTNAERLDPHNGLLLTPAFDHLFDQAYISFEDDGRILVSAQLPEAIMVAFGVDPTFRGRDLGTKTRAYLRDHRLRFWARGRSIK